MVLWLCIALCFVVRGVLCAASTKWPVKIMRRVQQISQTPSLDFWDDLVPWGAQLRRNTTKWQHSNFFSFQTLTYSAFTAFLCGQKWKKNINLGFFSAIPWCMALLRLKLEKVERGWCWNQKEDLCDTRITYLLKNTHSLKDNSEDKKLNKHFFMSAQSQLLLHYQRIHCRL